MLCFIAFLVNCQTSKLTSIQLHLLWKPYCDSGSSDYAVILPTSFPAMLSPLYLSQQWRLPFLRIGTRIAFYQSCSTHFFYAVPTSSQYTLIFPSFGISWTSCCLPILQLLQHQLHIPHWVGPKRSNHCMGSISVSFHSYYTSWQPITPVKMLPFVLILMNGHDYWRNPASPTTLNVPDTNSHFFPFNLSHLTSNFSLDHNFYFS